MTKDLEFERPVAELERKIDELRRIAGDLSNVPIDAELRDAPHRGGPALLEEISELERQARELLQHVMGSLSRWQIVQLSRHPRRPYMLDYVERIFSSFVELHGDRGFGDDGAIIGGLARLDDMSVMVIGHQKGRTTAENIARNFGMARPEGYRKAMRLMRLADRFLLPIVTFIDTPGAYPGIDAEERGQAQAIAESLVTMANVRVPIVSVVIGEGGSGGALALGVANRVLMLEFSVYSVISPEACSSILFRDASFMEAAAEALKLTARDLLTHKVIDDVVPEPLGGAHRDVDSAASAVKSALRSQLVELQKRDGDTLRNDRYERFRALGMTCAGSESRETRWMAK